MLSMTTSTLQADPLSQQIKALHEYSACDVCTLYFVFVVSFYSVLCCVHQLPLTLYIKISDALLKLQKTAPGQVARGGYLADIGTYILNCDSVVARF